MRKISIFTLSILCSVGAFATPIEFDTPNAHVVVIRPVDSWSPDASASEATLDAIRNKEASFLAILRKNEEGKPVYASGSLGGIFGTLPNDPFIQKAAEELKTFDYHIIRYGKPSITIMEPVSVEPSLVKKIIDVQSHWYKESVIAQGDPATLQDKVLTKKAIGTVLALGTMALGVDKLGASAGLSVTLSSGISDDVYRVVSAANSAMIPSLQSGTDFTLYKSVDIRRVKGTADRIGQIMIAYKDSKNSAAETDALLKAIVYAVGGGTTVDEVEKSRAEDYGNRIAIWNACVAEGDPRCKPR